MSSVTNIILTARGDADRALDEINSYFIAEHDGQKLLSIEGRVSGGKALEIGLFVGAFNYLHLDAFIAHLRIVHWGPGGWEHVRLFVKRQQDDVVGEVPL